MKVYCNKCRCFIGLMPKTPEYIICFECYHKGYRWDEKKYKIEKISFGGSPVEVLPVERNGDFTTIGDLIQSGGMKGREE